MGWQDTLETWEWRLKNWFGSRETIIGPNEPLPATDINAGNVRDYSGTAKLNEITQRLNGCNCWRSIRILKNKDSRPTGLRPTINLGKFINISQGKVHPRQNIWLSEKSLYKSVAIIGPPGSGKTEGFIIPGIKAAIDAGLSNIVIDVKGGELINKLGYYAEQKGMRVIYWSALPQEVSRSHSINLLDNINSLQEAKILAKSLYGNIDDLGENRRFASREITWIAQWIMLVKQVYGYAATLKDIYKIAESPVEQLEELVERCRDPELKAQIDSQLKLMEDDNSGIGFSWGIQDAISFLNWPNFVEVTGHSDILLRDIQSSPTLLVIGAELVGRDVSKKISSALIDVLMTIFYERWTSNNRGPGIVFWIDEFPRIQKQIDIEEFSSVSRSGRGSIVIAAQSLEQIDRNHREQVMENFNTVVLCRGASQGASEWLARRLGFRYKNERSRKHRKTNLSKRPFGWQFEDERYTSRRTQAPVLDTKEIISPLGGQYVAVVHARSACSKPFLVDYNKRFLEPSIPWQPTRSKKLIWREGEQNQVQGHHRPRVAQNLVFRESNLGEQTEERSNPRRVIWPD
ncbi:MAG: type IV secretory system conjugative DNA transfer family protein [Trichodesmium sp. MAG_R04]|nr:type IV secretory system conjugative DNA transfer family protein [Trichodesmium sp. MAG_R04]